MSLFTKTANDVFAPQDSAGVARELVPQEAQVWGSEVEAIVNAFVSAGGLIYSSKASLDADLAHAANSMAWVIGDATTANNGVYLKTGASGSGSWTRVADLPYSFIRATDTGAGTANAIQATSPIPVSESALIMMNIFEANTGSPVTVSFNGGSALTIKTAAGNNVVTGGLVAGMIVIGAISGSTFRLFSDQASAAVLAACEAAADRAEAAAALAGAGFIFPELLPSWNPADAAAAIEDACDISAASGGQVKLTAGHTYNVSKVVLTAAAKITALGAVIAVAGTLTGSDIDVTIGNFIQFDELVISSPGTETNTDICQVGLGVRGLYLEARSTSQRAGGGILVNPQDVDIAYVKTRKVDRPLHLYNTSVTAQTTGTRIGFLDCEDYVRAFRGTFTEFSLGGLWCVGRSPNASKSPGHNAFLIVGCKNWDIGDVWAEDTGEHVGRLGGSDGIWAVCANYKVGNITAIRCGGCAFKVNPTLKTTLTGTVAVTSGSAVLTGTGTSFTTALRVGSNVRITDTGEIYRVAAIASNTSATLDRNVTTTDASSALEVMEAAWNGEIGAVVGIDVGDPADAGNEELVRLSHVRGLKIGPCVAFRDGAMVSSQYLVQVNDIDDVEIGGIGGTGVNAGFISFDGTSDVDGVNQFGGDVTNLRIRMYGTCNGNNAIGVNTAFNIGKVTIELDNISGFLVNLVRWDAGTLNGMFEVRGRVSGTIAPAYFGVPNSDNFLIDVAYNNSRSIGRASGARSGTAVFEIMAAVFSSASQAANGLFINNARATAGSGSYGGGVEWSRLGSSRRAAAIVARQGSADDKEVGLSFFIGDTNTTSNEALLEAMILLHTGRLSLPMLPALTTYADNAAATAGGLAVGEIYRTSTGTLAVRF
ncbi:hypothetical protein [Sinorhizobium fredii]|uniref:hypothetical protein n=1 Tax=Rhizobium fredii TaxID=380 RepID=UPI000D5A5DEC|nr:hypothetical protein [Sinorhizobium fredii]AWI57192.1 hypothetical protein AB395_00001533 [Sinorhizobium fredii CCBAU 45436]